MPQPDYLCDVVIVNYNAGLLLRDCVASVRAQALPVHVIVVDNASEDDSLIVLEADRPTLLDGCLTVIRNIRNVGFATACNQGVKASSAPYVLFLNPDSTLSQGALTRLLAVLQSDDGIGMVGGMLCYPNGIEQPGGRRTFPTPGRAFVRAFGLSTLAQVFPKLCADFLLHQTPLPQQPTAVEAISGACMLVKRSALDEVGLWDELYFLHCEDLDWCMRFHQQGYRILFVPDAKVFHVWGACSRLRPIFVEWHKHHGMIRFYLKFFRQRYPLVLWWLVVVGVWLRFCFKVVYLSVFAFIRTMRGV